ncbi:MAG: hypothetical protein E7160_02060 [Firmicutes bacterium]|nr:hypothetical protein [Bacillota bacterium]
MKNIELLNICYKFFNRFITASTLVEELAKIDKKNIPQENVEKIESLIGEIKEVLKNNPNRVDEYVTIKKEKIKNLIEKLDKIPKANDNSKMLEKHIKNLKNDYEKEMDSHERWAAVMSCITKNEYFNNIMDNLTKNELLEFIVQYIQAPLPPHLTQKEFDELSEICIKNDKREWLWRLAFNYSKRNINFDKIVDYYIEKKDDYYLSELICAVGTDLDIDKIIDSINDQELIDGLKSRKSILESHVTEEQLNKIINK